MQKTYHSLNVIVAQSKNCPFGVNTNITTTSDNNSIYCGIFQLGSVPVLSEVVVILLSSIDVLIPNGSFLLVPLLHSVSDMISEPNNIYVCELVLEEADCSLFFGVTVMWACTFELYVF